MPGVLETLWNHYIWLLESGDPRTAPWLLVYSPLPVALLLALYLLLVLLGPRVMSRRPPLQLTGPLAAYNLGLVLLSGYIFYQFLTTSLLADYSYFCQPVDYSPSELGMRMARVCWWCFFSKAVELLDTVFLVLRKKQEQLTFLHVFHHGTMLLNWWAGVKYVPGGQGPVCGNRRALLLQPLCRVLLPGRVQPRRPPLRPQPHRPFPQLLPPDVPAGPAEEAALGARTPGTGAPGMHLTAHPTTLRMPRGWCFLLGEGEGEQHPSRVQGTSAEPPPTTTLLLSPPACLVPWVRPFSLGVRPSSACSPTPGIQ
ncbi:elongation of very long chain fatty acids protein 1-like isoform X3 [Sorex araneus]|uniref:elongation of very long chain fatty acids protein 1-like isoform X3 n=1 Tax=Sorex araneus TaxID=42254 RepID=UPI0024337A70|nr:elongation of very long chain fatty acids protein 1-like isoform X3 [Sorex araneus]